MCRAEGPRDGVEERNTRPKTENGTRDARRSIKPPARCVVEEPAGLHSLVNKLRASDVSEGHEQPFSQVGINFISD